MNALGADLLDWLLDTTVEEDELLLLASDPMEEEPRRDSSPLNQPHPRSFAAICATEDRRGSRASESFWGAKED